MIFNFNRIKSPVRSIIKLHYLTLFLLGLLTACIPSKDLTEFRHSIKTNPKPWTNEEFEASEEDFTFAIISDLNGGEREGVYTTAVSQLNRLEPVFVLSVGDLIDGGTEDTAQLTKEWDSFDKRTEKLQMPFFYLGGNHDLTNPKMREFWQERYGPRYYHFIYNDVLFLMMDSEDYEEKRMMEIYEARATAIKIIDGLQEGSYEDSDYYNMQERRVGALGDEQYNYFKNVIETNRDVKWIFVLMHKPLYLRDDDKGFKKMEALLYNKPFTVINGHFHSLKHQKRNNRDYIMLGTTGGGQIDNDANSFDHITLIRMAKEPIITHIRMDGILTEHGTIPEEDN